MIDWWQRAQLIIPNITEALIVFVSGLVLIPLIRRIFAHILKGLRLSKALRDVTQQIIGYVLYAIWLISMLYAFGFTGLAATLSGGVLIIGVGVSQAFRDLLAAIISGFAMARDRDFEVGYEVEINGKTTGVIEHIGTRKVRIIDATGRLHVLPNSMVENSEWVILNRDPKPKKIATTKKKGS